MENHKLIILLKTLTPQELQRLGIYLQSPYYNQNTKNYLWFLALRPYLHSRNKKEINPKELWKITFKSKTVNAATINKTNFILMQLTTHFLQTHFQNINTIANQIQVAQVFNEKKLPNHFATISLKKNKTIMSKGNSLDTLNWQIALYKHFEQLQQRKHNPNLSSLHHSLDIYYLETKLKYWCAALHYEYITGQKTTINLQDPILQLLQNNVIDLKSNYVLHIYYCVLKILMDIDSEANYFELKQLIFSKKNIDIELQKDSMMYAINFCIRKINKGFSQFTDELFELYKFSLSNKIIALNKSISPWDYKNIIMSALYANAIEWAEKFIQKYSKYLPVEEQTNAYSYNMAKIYFVKKDYKTCLNLLIQTEYTDPFYQLGSKLTQAKALYELGELQTLHDLLISFRKLLNRKKGISKQHIASYKNFINYLNKLTTPNKIKDTQLLLDSIKKQSLTFDKSWLINKASIINNNTIRK